MKHKQLIAEIAWVLTYVRREEMSAREIRIALKLIDQGIMRWAADGKLEPTDAGELMAAMSE